MNKNMNISIPCLQPNDTDKKNKKKKPLTWVHNYNKLVTKTMLQ